VEELLQGGGGLKGVGGLKDGGGLSGRDGLVEVVLRVEDL